MTYDQTVFQTKITADQTDMRTKPCVHSKFGRSCLLYDNPEEKDLFIKL